ncbi:MAG: glycerol-3-phosphate 1-O-acyltransferase [Verrucomicrobia bacterium]|nr:glycerol-3-phosphate 1-O-acyltransferase [Verrucomicrobiota bacterium]NDC00059.1 glycerol-3-phosphate 1-O-acyltransferase [Verrucomicrobiota bacterium]NDF16904.1 glycerol-3-phosphate 1-O-acyltransferase [Verrucomicrobiota bacterium]
MRIHGEGFLDFSQGRRPGFARGRLGRQNHRGDFHASHFFLQGRNAFCLGRLGGAKNLAPLQESGIRLKDGRKQHEDVIPILASQGFLGLAKRIRLACRQLAGRNFRHKRTSYPKGRTTPNQNPLGISLPFGGSSPIPKGVTIGFLLFGAGFLIGSIPFGAWIARSQGVDIQKRGSGNIGATNVGRVLGKKWGYLVFLLDALKGWFAVWLAAEFLQAGDAASVLTGVAAVAGHVFSPWLNFKGGKGVATSAGVLLGLAPVVLIWTAAIWGFSFFVKRIVSVSSLLAATSFPFLVLWLEPGRQALLAAAFALAGLVWYRHRDNLQRLVRGTENGFEKKRPARRKGKTKR